MKLHNALNRGPVSEGVTRALGLHDGGAGVERYGETLTPVLNLWGMPEWCVLRGEGLKGQRLVSAAVVGENSVIALVNVATRNRIVVVELAGVQAGSGAQSYSLELCTDAVLAAALAVANAGPTIPRDTRYIGGGVFIRTGSEVATSLGTSIDLNSITAGGQSIYFQNLPVVLSPGFGLAIIGQAQNLAVGGIFGWRERPALPGELSP